MTTPATSSRLRPTWIAMCALLAAIGIAVSGCGLLPISAPTPTPDGYSYEDSSAGFGIVFPGEPTIEPIAGNEAGAQRASYSTTEVPEDPDGVYYVAGGTKSAESEIDSEALEGTLFRLLNAGATDLAEEETELAGLPAWKGDLTWLDGKPASVLVAGEGHTFYQLIVIGGTQEERDEFFDSFFLLE